MLRFRLSFALRLILFSMAVVALTVGVSDWIVYHSILEGAVVSVALALSLTVVAARTLSGPVNRLVRATRSIAAGELSTRVAVDRSDELGELASGFNEMAEALEKAQAEARQNQDALQAANVETASANERLNRSNQELAGMVRQAQDLVAEAQKANQSKSEFLAMMSHELRTPMNSILGFTSLLREGALDEDQIRYVETVSTSAEGLLELINDILDFSKIEAGKMELESIPISISEVSGGAMTLLAPRAAEKDLDLCAFVSDLLPDVILGDDVRLRQILVNLIGNAIKFTPSGSVALVVDGAPVSGSFGDRKVWELTFSVQDSGVGIPRGKLDLLFKPFSQVDSTATRKFGGTGLGLAICHRLAEAMGGRMWVESEEGKGSVFSFSIRVPVETGDPGPRRPDGVRLVGRRALVLTTSPIQGRFLVESLERLSMTALLVRSPDDLARLAGEACAFDVIFTDLDRSPVPPEALSPEARAKWVGSHAPVVMLAALRRGADPRPLPVGVRLINKPLQLRDVYQACLDSIPDPASQAQPDPKPSNTVLRGHCAVSATPRGGGAAQSLRVMVVGEDLRRQPSLVDFLFALGHQPDATPDGKSAAIAARHKPFDVLLIRVDLPSRGASEALAFFRRGAAGDAARNIPALAFHLEPGGPSREECLSLGFLEVLREVDSQAELERALGLCLPRLVSPGPVVLGPAQSGDGVRQP